MYSVPIITAFCLFPFIALLITFPYILIQYGKYGSVNLMRTVIIYSLILYLLCSYFLVILPLPSIEEVKSLNTPTIQLIPFHFIIDIVNTTPFIISDVKTYLESITDPNFLQVAYNLVLLLPLGLYLRYYFKKSLLFTTILVFSFSLFFELTQLSGLYGIYPRPYRLFDVDDLIINTIGGLIGYFIAPLLSKILPSREEIDKKSFKKGEEVSNFRRFNAFIIDWMFIVIFSILLSIIFGFPNILEILSFDNIKDFVFYVIYIFIYFALIPFVTNGKTLGKKIVNIKLYKENIKFYHYIFRAFLLYLILLPSIRYSIIILTKFNSSSTILSLIVSIVNIFLFLLFIVNTFRFLFAKKRNKNMLFHEKITKVINISTIKIDKKEN